MGGWHRGVSGSLLIAVLAASCASDGAPTAGSAQGSTDVTDTSANPTPPHTSAAPTAPAPSTTAPTVTVADTTPVSTGATTIPHVPVPTVAAPPARPFDPPCVEHEPVRSRPTGPDEAVLSGFGRLGSAPSIEIVMPSAGADADAGVDVHRIPGGLLLGFTSDANSVGDAMLTAVDHDGLVRWQRCFAGGLSNVIVADASLEPSSALMNTGWTAEGRPVYEVLSLADGSIIGSVAGLARPEEWTEADMLAVSVAAIGERFVAITPDPTSGPIRRLALVDLVDMSVDDVPTPPRSDTAGYVEFASADTLIIGTYDQPAGSPGNAVLVDGVWRTDDDAWLTARPTVVGYHYEADGGTLPHLEVSDGLGNIIWSRPDIPTINGEGFNHMVIGDVVVQTGCFELDDIGSCTRYVTGGYALASGKTLWQREGPGAVAAGGDGLALMTVGLVTSGATIWGLVDVHTGDTIDPAQQWDQPWSFGTECCGGDVFQRAEQHGGIVVTVTDGVLRVFHPAASAIPTVHLDQW